MPKQRQKDHRHDDGRKTKPRRSERRQHLYLVLDDWEWGYSDRKIDLDAPSSSSCWNTDDSREDGERVLDLVPQIIRLEAQRGHARFFAAHVAKIFALPPSTSRRDVPVFDTEELSVGVGPRPREHDLWHFISVGDRLYSLQYSYFEELGPPPPPDSKERWSWSRVPSSLPFDPWDIRSYAVHPDANLLFGTRRREWTRHGNWLLPFNGQGYCDCELDAWVGFRRDKVGGSEAGHVCSCDVVPPVDEGGECQTPPAWKLGAERMFRPDSGRHIGGTLVHVGGGEFCLVEYLLHKDAGEKPFMDKDDYRSRCQVLGVAKFRLRHGNRCATG